KQVISNLISNAIKFSPQGNVIVEVSLLSLQDMQAHIKVTVRDEGIGLTQEQKERLFRAFVQADTSSTREYGGTGLGLAICKGLVERMKGEIGVESEPEKGSDFWFTAYLGVDKKQPPPPSINLADKHVLICGENPMTRAQLEQLLQLWHTNCHTIDTIHDIFTALRSAYHTPQAFSLVILDIAPNERKIHHTLLHKLAEQFAEEFGCGLAVCCTPAHQRVFKAGIENSRIAFINKPIIYDTLLQVVSRQLNISVKEPRLVSPIEETRYAHVSVLIVDDNPANLQLATELLRGLNTFVIQASSGQQALDLCAAETFDIIFMDIQMPGMDGRETTRRLRSMEGDKRRTPIIALTSHSIIEQKAELLIAGMDDCISKPVREAQLAHIISPWIGMAGQKDLASVNELPARATPPELPVIHDVNDRVTSVDITLCLKLANNKPALARDMLVMLLDSLPNEKAQINRAFSEKDFEQMEDLVHRLY